MTMKRKYILQYVNQYTDNNIYVFCSQLSQLQLSEGGKPIRNLIFTTWRSGSSFVGEAVASHPLTFYHYEPLMYKGIVQIGPESEKDASNAINTVKALLNCDFSHAGNLKTLLTTDFEIF